MCKLEQQVGLFLEQSLELVVHLRRRLDHHDVDTLEDQLDHFVVLLVDLAALFLRLFLHLDALRFRDFPVFLDLYRLVCLFFGVLVQQLVEQVEVDREDGMPRVDMTRADKDASRLVEEAQSVDPVRWLDSGSHQENRDFSQDCRLDLFSVFTMEPSEDPDHSVDSVTLHFLDRIAELVDDHADNLGGQIGLFAVGQDLGADVQGCLLLELEIGVAHLYQDLVAELAEELSHAVLVVGLNDLVVGARVALADNNRVTLEDVELRVQLEEVALRVQVLEGGHSLLSLLPVVLLG